MADTLEVNDILKERMDKEVSLIKSVKDYFQVKDKQTSSNTFLICNAFITFAYSK